MTSHADDPTAYAAILKVLQDILARQEEIRKHSVKATGSQDLAKRSFK